MCKFLTNWNRVKVLAYLELILTIFTVCIIAYAYISNRQLLGEIKTQNAQNEQVEKQLNSTISEDTGSHKYVGRTLVFLGFCGMIGILCCVATVLTGKFGNLSSTKKWMTIGCWFWLNALTMIILTFIWGGLIFFVALGHQRVNAGADIQIPFALCYLFRGIIMLVIWKIRKYVTGESESTAAVDVEKEIDV